MVEDFGRSAITPGNRAMLGIMRRNTLEADLRAVLESQGAAVHYWGDRSDVSSAPWNRVIRGRLSHRPGYRYGAQSLGGELADHSLTNVWALGIAATGRAVQLLNEPLAA